MLTISINEFTGYDSKSLYEFLMLQNQTEFKIKIPKIYIPGDDNFQVFWEYHQAAYVGHQLAEIARSFAYYVPAPSKLRPFIFEVEIKDIEIFADQLSSIINAYDENTLEELVIPFQEAACEFFIAAYDNKLVPHTWGLLVIANDHLPAYPG